MDSSSKRLDIAALGTAAAAILAAIGMSVGFGFWSGSLQTKYDSLKEEVTKISSDTTLKKSIENAIAELDKQTSIRKKQIEETQPFPDAEPLVVLEPIWTQEKERILPHSIEFSGNVPSFS
jgi:hypothetical protein